MNLPSPFLNDFSIDKTGSEETMRAGGLVLMVVLMGGCGTTRMSGTNRTATEQQLISHAVDQAVSQLDFRVLRGKKVYFDDQYIDKSQVDRGYLVSSLRQQIVANGCLLQSKKEDAQYIIEARCGGMGTDRHELLIGVPAMSLPTVLPGQPSSIPEIPFAKKTDQHGIAKIAVFAYQRNSGLRVWQSGMVNSQSSAKDLWLVGAGPFQHGSIRSRVTLAGQGLAVPFITSPEEEVANPSVDVGQAFLWSENLPDREQIVQTAGMESTSPDPQKESAQNAEQTPGTDSTPNPTVTTYPSWKAQKKGRHQKARASHGE